MGLTPPCCSTTKTSLSLALITWSACISKGVIAYLVLEMNRSTTTRIIITGILRRNIIKNFLDFVLLKNVSIQKIKNKATKHKTIKIDRYVVLSSGKYGK